MFGKICKNITLKELHPMARAAVTYSPSLSESVLARTTLANRGVYTIDKATIRVLKLGPKIATNARASSIGGNAKIASISLIKKLSK